MTQAGNQMASAARTDNKRRIEALEDQVKKLQDEQQAARRRLDRVERVRS